MALDISLMSTVCGYVHQIVATAHAKGAKLDCLRPPWPPKALLGPSPLVTSVPCLEFGCQYQMATEQDGGEQQTSVE